MKLCAFTSEISSKCNCSSSACLTFFISFKIQHRVCYSTFEFKFVTKTVVGTIDLDLCHHVNWRRCEWSGFKVEFIWIPTKFATFAEKSPPSAEKGGGLWPQTFVEYMNKNDLGWCQKLLFCGRDRVEISGLVEISAKKPITVSIHFKSIGIIII